MPISDVYKTIQGRSFTLKLSHGHDDRGKNIYTSKTFSNLNDDATDADIVNVANALAELQEHVLAEIGMTVKNVLM